MSLLVPSGLFAAFQLWPTRENQDVAIHALVFMSSYWVLSKALGLVLSRIELVTATALSLIVSLPVKSRNVNTVLLKSLAFALLLTLARKVTSKFQTTSQ